MAKGVKQLKKPLMTKKKFFIGAMILLTIYVVFGLDKRIQTSNYIIDSSKVERPIKLALITDLHSCDYGEQASELMAVINKSSPDLVLLGGDIIDDKMPIEHALIFLEAVSAKYPCYYVSGNHEEWTGNLDNIKELVEGYGIKVLAGDVEAFILGQQRIEIAGIDDYAIGEFQWKKQLKAVSGGSSENFRVLLTHRPYIEGINMEAYYDNDAFDLALTGHVHGGQWRFPGLIKGLIGPSQGLFPEFTGGLYELEGSQMILSRGLAKESTKIFRFYNRPEVVFVTIQ